MNLKSKCYTCGIFYLAGLLLILGMKYFYSNAGSNELLWILAPTSWWVRTLSGFSFEYEPFVGYVNHELRFIIAPSCSGVQFMIITMTVLIFSFIHRMDNNKKRLLWFSCSLVLSYPVTILVNGIRIVLSIYLPRVLPEANFFGYTLSPEKLHSLIGTAVYFSSLLLIYLMAGQLIGRRMISAKEKTDSMFLKKLTAPVFWYFFVLLGIPFLNRAYQNNLAGFLEYAVLVAFVSLSIVIILCIMVTIRNKFKRSY